MKANIYLLCERKIELLFSSMFSANKNFCFHYRAICGTFYLIRKHTVDDLRKNGKKDSDPSKLNMSLKPQCY